MNFRTRCNSCSFGMIFLFFSSTRHKYGQLRVENKHHTILFIYFRVSWCWSHSDYTNPSLFLLICFSCLLHSFMDWVEKLLFVGFIILAAAIDGAQADALVTGTVFCDQCKDGERSLFDYPISGEIHNILHFCVSSFSLFCFFVFGNFGDIL